MLTITPSAVKKLKELMIEDPNTIALRVYVKGGGCSGYSYGMLMETASPTDEDTVIERDEVKIFVDSQSAPMLIGSEVDYLDQLQGSGFAVKNPIAKTTCGCGSSFSV